MIGTGRERLQMLVRVSIFRLVSDTFLKEDVGMYDVLGIYETAVNIIEEVFIRFNSTLDI